MRSSMVSTPFLTSVCKADPCGSSRLATASLPKCDSCISCISSSTCFVRPARSRLSNKARFASSSAYRSASRTYVDLRGV